MSTRLERYKKHGLHSYVCTRCDEEIVKTELLEDYSTLKITFKNSVEKAFVSMTVKNALSLFASTSPSYLILQSLDAANKYIADGYQRKLADFIEIVDSIKTKLSK